MPHRRVMVVIGTRPEAIKMAPVILALERLHRELTPVVCVTGQHRELLDPVLRWFRVHSDYDLDLMRPNQSLPEFAGRALIHMDGLLRDAQPDAVLVQGDTTTAMVAALAAFYRSIPVGHVEAGLRTRDLASPFPEEMNRRVAGVVARFHFAPTETAARALFEERVDPRFVFTVGNTVVDALRLTLGRLPRNRWCAAFGSKRIVLVTAHRRENFGRPLESICHAIADLADHHRDCQFVYPLHLNPNARSVAEKRLHGHPRVHLCEPLRYQDFVRVLSRSELVLTDSGGVQEEAAVLGKATLVLRDSTERTEAVEFGTARVIGTASEAIVEAASRELQRERVSRSEWALDQCPFGDGYAADRITKILLDALSAQAVQAVA